MMNDPPEGERPLGAVTADQTEATADFLVEHFSFAVVLTALEAEGGCHINVMARGGLPEHYVSAVVESLRLFADGIERGQHEGEVCIDYAGHA